MDPLQNPFTPGAGAPPPELVGRDAVIQETEVLLGRIKKGRPEKSILMTGLRGVGKTVLLNHLKGLATASDYRVVFIEAAEEKPLVLLLAPVLRSLLFDLNRTAAANEKARRALAVFKGFLTAVKVKYGELEIGLDIDSEKGTADSGDLEADLAQLLGIVADAAKERGTAVALLIDELQYLGEKELAALIVAMHRMQQEQHPVVLIGAGLPSLPALAGEAKSYAERLFNYPRIGALSEGETRDAVRKAVRAQGAAIDDDAIHEIFLATKGYPFFVQEWAYQAWNVAADSPISRADVRHAHARALKRLDEGFFTVRFGRLTPREKEFLRAMAHLGPGPHKLGDVAHAFGLSTTSVGPHRANLIHKGMVYSPEHGQIAFTVPLFDQFLKRVMPDFAPAGTP
ncbi:MAG: AAA family ATPase [Thermoplasmatota archaeon]